MSNKTMEEWKKEFFKRFAAGSGKWKVFTEGMITTEQVWEWVEEMVEKKATDIVFTFQMLIEDGYFDDVEKREKRLNDLRERFIDK